MENESEVTGYKVSSSEKIAAAGWGGERSRGVGLWEGGGVDEGGGETNRL